MTEVQSPQRPARLRGFLRPAPVLSSALLLCIGLTQPAFGQAAAAAPAAAAPAAAMAPAQTPAAQPLGANQQDGARAGADDTRNQNTRVSRGSVLLAPPDRLTDFQRTVQETTGQPLAIFGASLFANVPSTFAPVEDVPVGPDYVLGPGDELRVQVFGQVNQQSLFAIDRSGDISLPQIGPVHLAGLRFSEAQTFLKTRLGQVYRNFDVSVGMGRLRSIQVFVVGEARRPGAYTVSSLSTLLNALFASGGVLPQGSLRDIQVQRGKQTIAHFDLYDLLLHGDKSKDIPLQNEDVIFIPVAGPQTAVLGSVPNPAIYETLPGTTVQQAIDLAGGLTSLAAGAHIRLERVFEHTMRSVVDVDIAQGQNPYVQTGDIVTVPAVLDKFHASVTLRGNVANPGRYVWHEGMHVLDLIPSRDALVTRNYFRRRNELGQISSDYGENQTAPSDATEGAVGPHASATPSQAIQRGSAQGQSGNSVATALTSNSGVFQAKNDVVLSAPDINWSYAVIERLDARTLTTSLIPFNLGKVVLDRDPAENKELLDGDVVTIFSNADINVPTSQQTRFVRLEGEFVASGVYSVQPGETLRHLLKRAGGLTPDAYLYASEFTRESTRRVERQRLNEYAQSLDAQVTSAAASSNAKAINDRDAASATASLADAREAIARLRQQEPIGRIVLPLTPDSHDIDSLPDLALEDGDRFVVPRLPSVVNVAGQVYSANAFVYSSGRRTIDYLRQAGGPDRQADAKRTFVIRADGSVFSNQYGKVDRALINPGDTIVVPLRLDRRAILRNLLDISNIVGQFGLGAAAIEVLK
ncbi:protein involved in polysaccharide export, contains SLBB domain of the beta-grasp fold [Granulicella rosea]|uniref:Protein involved in polysaccharide export, contains SLBB domain of the beta-grasp fold n=1 Tax=Granulicella rosea TaxID=474952 RepID=A0A239CVB2_9BACT|nr:SLBB domain-containing protein [Granulicella rosea]SNS23802.1 protein involved in polysaccharide export, contains SLBB domain of the beta-grasp fold [Granulicella rosea]